MRTEHGTVPGQHLVVDTPIGALGIGVTPLGLRRVDLPRSARRAPRPDAGQSPPPAGHAILAAKQIMEYLRGERREFDLPLDLSDVDAQMRTVLHELCARAPYGKVITYGELATWTACPGGARAVGQIMARNPIPLVIPCHRVVAAGDLGGYGGGLPLKRRLLRLENALTEQLSLLGDT